MLDISAWAIPDWTFIARNGHHWYTHGSRLYRCSLCGITCHEPDDVGITCHDLQAFQQSYQAALYRARALVALWGMSA